MNHPPERFVVRGEIYVGLRGIADCYGVQLNWVEEVYRFGLLGRGEPVGEHVAIAATKLDRFARIVRLHIHYGVDLTVIPGLLDPEEP